MGGVSGVDGVGGVGGVRWELVSDTAFQPTDEMVPIAHLEQVIRPEDLAPAPGTVIDEPDLSTRFGLEVEPRTARHGGHLFVFIDQKGVLQAPDRIHSTAISPRPGETAFVLARIGGGEADRSWRYLGVARAIADSAQWQIPSVDDETWRTWGERRDGSTPVGR